MARSWAGAALSERLYRAARLLALGLVYLLRALWKGLGLDGGKNAPGVVTTFLDKAYDLLVYYHELSLAMSHDYFIKYSLIENPTHILSPVLGEDGEPYRARWGAMDTVVAEELGDMTDVILQGRVAEIPGATELIVDDKAYADVHDVDAFPRVAEVMGPEFAGELVEESDAPGVVDGPEDVAEPSVSDPIVVCPDPQPVSEGNAKTRLQIKGPDNLEKQTAALHDAEYLDEQEKAKRIQDKSDKSWVRSANAATSLADAGVDYVNAAAASQGMGVVRVLGPNPCSFCVALAALGVIYEQGFWDKSNSKFRTHMSKTGKSMQGGNAKVHDGCQCRLEPVPLNADESTMPPGVAEAQALWRQATGQMPDEYSWTEQYNNFRKMFRDGEFTDTVIEFERPEVLDKREEIKLGVAGAMVHLAFLTEFVDDASDRDDVEFSIRLYREQLEYNLQLWEKYGNYDTDWTQEYEWMLARAATMVNPAEGETFADMARENPVFEKTVAFRKWLLDLVPDGPDRLDEFWPADRMGSYPMPDFR